MRYSAERENATAKYRLLGFFRLLLAALVVLQHSLGSTTSPGFRSWVEPYEVGLVAVLVFFAVSGFIIAEAASSIYGGRPVAFITNRFLRIYPTYLLALAVTVIVLLLTKSAGGPIQRIEAWMHVPSITGPGVLANILGILPGGRSLMAAAGADFILGIAWALQIELFFYLCIFALMVGGRLLGISFGTILAVSGAVALAFYGYALPNLRGGGLEFIPYFTLGAALYFATRNEGEQIPIPAAIIFAVSAALIWVDIAGKPAIHADYDFRRALGGQVAIFSGCIAIWIALLFFPGRRKPLSGKLVRVDRAVGELTYPLYLLHIPALIVLVWIGPERGATALVLGFVASLATAWVAYCLFETRLARLRSRVRGFRLTALQGNAADAGSPPATINGSLPPGLSAEISRKELM